jgi:hypothetical protein
MKKLIPLLVVILAALSVCSSAAQAFLACKNTGTRHCYAVTSWSMTNGETVLGTSIQLDTIYASVPEKGSGEEEEFLTNEMWDTFDGGKHWVEEGQIVNYGGAFNYFWDTYNHEGFSEIHQFCCATTNQWNTYKMQFDNQRESTHAWDFYINGTFEGIGEGLERASTEVEAGLETTNAKNTNYGQTAYAENLGTQGEWWASWEASGAGNYAKPETFNYWGEPWSGGCAFNEFSEGHKGDINFYNQACGSDADLDIPTATQGGAPRATAEEGGSPESSQQIAEVVQRQSSMAGEPTPSDAIEVDAPRNEALSVALPGVHAAPSTEVATVVVEMHGHFTSSLVPRHAEPATGSVMTLVIDAHTGQVIGRHIGNESVPMSSLGTATAVQ